MRPCPSPSGFHPAFVLSLFFASLMSGTFPARAATYTFTGAGGNPTPGCDVLDGPDWHDPCNWDPRGVPGGEDTAVIGPHEVVFNQLELMSG